jgi:two-component system nitrogen regulation sensor histidine kinase NtrY
MIAVATPADMEAPRMRRLTVTPALEFSVLGIAVVIAIGSYVLLTGLDDAQRLIPPPLVALLLVANLVPGIALLVLLGRRIAKRRAARSPVGGEGRLHVRLVALFSVVAAVPMLLVTIFASLLFQYGVQFWYSDQARGMLENATSLAQTSYDQMLRRWQEASVTMASDTADFLSEQPVDGGQFPAFFFQQVWFRSLSDGILFTVSPRTGLQTLATINPDLLDINKQVSASDLAVLRAGQRSITVVRDNRIQTLTKVPRNGDLYLLTASVVDMTTVQQQRLRGVAVQRSYRDLLAQARSLQLRFNAALLIISLLIVGVAVWIALNVADRLVRPVGELVDAARRVAGGDLTARVPDPRSLDEVGTLAKAFNQMTGRIEAQNTQLRTANDQLDSRRALIEAVMAGVSAGVIAVGADRVVSIANDSAVRLLGTGVDGVIGQPLHAVAPELDALVDAGAREAVVQVGQDGQIRTLAVRLAVIDRGPILTFDDVTQQLVDQRRAAWSDVARRIAHEIKNPLTPIQLAAERLQRRYGAKIAEDDGTFARLTETIVRQVGDLRRMVDEFSSFARMPKPVFREESLLDAAHQVLFLHEVAHPAIRFALVHDDVVPTLVCDRRQIGQALTNIVKNAVEAIEARSGGGEGGQITLTLAGEAQGSVSIVVTDNGVGLPAARERITEPYMTTRVRGTGLGLAIVKKIVEEHYGTIGFTDRSGGGTVVTMTFDAAALERLDQGGIAAADASGELGGDGQLAVLTPNRTWN